MNIMINISDLPEEIKDCYNKWSKITKIDNLDIFFEDILLNSQTHNNLKYKSTIIKGDVFEINCGNSEEAGFILFIKKPDGTVRIAGVMMRFIKTVNEAYETINN